MSEKDILIPALKWISIYSHLSYCFLVEFINFKIRFHRPNVYLLGSTLLTCYFDHLFALFSYRTAHEFHFNKPLWF